MGSDTDAVFRALADPTRRFLLDALHERNGQTLGELCARLAMTRQSATQHLDVLEAAALSLRSDGAFVPVRAAALSGSRS